MNIISKRFMVAELDMAIAQKYSQICAGKKQLLIDLAGQFDFRKDKMKFDQLIVAMALFHGASCIYSHDGHVKKFAGDLIEVREMEDQPIQTTLFPEGLEDLPF